MARPEVPRTSLATTTFGYEAPADPPGVGRFNRLTSVTTPVTAPNPTTTPAYDDTARTITVTDALSHSRRGGS
jgi:hypothetical protein